MNIDPHDYSETFIAEDSVKSAARARGVENGVTDVSQGAGAYRESGFVLSGITDNSTLYEFPDGERVANIGIKTGYEWQKSRFGKVILGEAALQEAKRLGAKKLVGYQLRYIYFLDPTARERLTVPILPFSEIDRRGAGMYKGKPRVRSVDSDTSGDQPEMGGANPTRTLHTPEVTE